MSANDGGPAFPRSDAGYSVTQDGMSLRDWFAGQWLLGASQYWAHTAPERLATEAYAIAKAMIAERATQP